MDVERLQTLASQTLAASGFEDGIHVCVDIVHVVEYFGFQVYDTFSHPMLIGQMFVSDEKRLIETTSPLEDERARWAIAQCFAGYLLGYESRDQSEPFQVMAELDPVDLNVLYLSECLLLPEVSFRRWYQMSACSSFMLQTLARRFQVSTEVVAQRIAYLKR